MQLVDVVHEHLVEELLVLPVLGLVLVESQLLHPLLRPLRLLRRQLLLPLLLLLLRRLNRLKLLKHILVVQDRVRKLIPEVLLIQQLLDALGNHGVAEDGVDVGPLLRVHIEHALQQVGDVFAEVARHVVVLALNDFMSELMKGLSIKRWLQRTHLIKKDPERPNVRLKAVGLGLYDLGRQVVRRADHSLGLGLSLAEHASNTEIAQLYHVFFRQENVLGFKVSVQNLSIMNMFQSEADLREPIQYVILAPVLQLPTCPLFLLVLVLDAAL